MYNIRYLSLLAMLLWCGIAIHGQDEFNPSSPAEPDAPDVKTRLTLTAMPSDGGSVSGAGTYSIGSSVYVSASASSSYAFDYWENEDGDTVSTDRVFYLTKGNGSEALTAHFRFVPGSPSEPDLPSTTLYYRLTSQTSTGGSVSGGGRYQMGTQVTVNAYPETGFYFTQWTDKDGNVVSTSSSYRYTMQDYSDTLTAHFQFDPSSPSEPSDPILRKTITVSCGEGGYYNGSTGRILQGNSITLTAYANTSYDFVGWYLNGEFYTSLRQFSYTVGEGNADFYALFTFNPSSPNEPLQPALDQYNFYLMTVNATPGSTMSYPMFLASTQAVGDMTFNLTFPTAMMPDLEDIVVSELATGYTTSLTALNDSVFIFSMIGGHTDACTTQFLTFNVEVNDSIVPGSSWQVKINQISLTQDDGNTVTARTRNGRMGVYDWGDASLDGEVNIIDSRMVLDDWLGTGTEELDMHISDIVNDGELNILDSRAILDTWLNTSTKAGVKKKEQRTKTCKVL